MPLGQGEIYAGFTVLRPLGAGAMGEVYLVDHPRLPRREALKILPVALTADNEFRHRFNREADVAAELWHPHIVAVHDRGESNGQLWITMDYVEGTDAAALVRDRYPNGLPPQFAAEIVDAVAEALDYAHERGLLHRDVKPANILLSEPSGSTQRRRILLSDFGIARRIDDNVGLTATNMTVGSLAYAPPEQLMGVALDGRTDQYALAATAFQLLTGRPPYDNSNAAVVISSHLSSPPPVMADRRPELAHLDPVISKAMAKEPADRYATCRDFATALSELIEATPQTDHATLVAPAAAQALASPPPGASSAPAAGTKPAGGKRIWLAAAAIAAAVLVVAGIVVVPRMMGSGGADEPSPTAAPSSPVEVSTSPVAAPGSQAEAADQLVPPEAVGGLMLTPAQVSEIVGSDLPAATNSNAPFDASSEFNRPECTGAIYPLEARMYDPSGFTAADQSLVVPAEGTPGNHIVDMSVALMPTAERAEQFRTDSEREWQACASQELTITRDGIATRPALAEVRVQGDLIIQDRTVTGDNTPPGQRCQHTLGVWSNVVAEAVVCNDTNIGDQSQRVVNAILENAKRA